MTKASPYTITNKLARELLKKKGIYLIRKSTRAGGTHSITLNAQKNKETTLANFQPRIAILKEIKRASKENFMNYFESNIEICPIVKELCEREPWRYHLPEAQTIPKYCYEKCIMLAIKQKEKHEEIRQTGVTQTLDEEEEYLKEFKLPEKTGKQIDCTCTNSSLSEPTYCRLKDLSINYYHTTGITYQKLSYTDLSKNTFISNLISEKKVILYDEVTELLASENASYTLKKKKTLSDMFSKSFGIYYDQDTINKDAFDLSMDLSFDKEIIKEILGNMWSDLKRLTELIDKKINIFKEKPLQLKDELRNVIGIFNPKEEVLNFGKGIEHVNNNNRIKKGIFIHYVKKYTKLKPKEEEQDHFNFFVSKNEQIKKFAEDGVKELGEKAKEEYIFPIDFLRTLFEIYASDLLLIKFEGETDETISLLPIMLDYNPFQKEGEEKEAVEKLLLVMDASYNKELLKMFLPEANEFKWGDPLGTNQYQLIVCDTKNWTSKDNWFKLKGAQKNYIFEGIEQIARRHKRISLISPDSPKWQRGVRNNFSNDLRSHRWSKGIIERKRDDDKIEEQIEKLEKEGKAVIIIDHRYHRDKRCRGVATDPLTNVQVHFGLPRIPKDAFLSKSFITKDHPAFKLDENKINAEELGLKNLSKDIWFSSFLCSKLRDNNEASTFNNMIGRIKDPLINPKTEEEVKEKDIKKTFIYVIGAKKEQIDKMLKDTDCPPACVIPYKSKRMFKDGLVMEQLFRENPINYWSGKKGIKKTIENELPLLAYIINETKRKGKLNQILKMKKVVRKRNKVDTVLINKIIRHKELLVRFNVGIKKTKRGLNFKFQKDIND